MVFEDFQTGSAKAANADLNAKLFASAYCTDKPVIDERNSQCGADTKDTKETPRPKESTETPEQRMDQKIKDKFGSDVFDHLKDWDWLIENRKKLEDGFKALNKEDAYDVARRMRELSTEKGKEPLIYFNRTPGQTAGSLLEKRYDIYLRRGSWRSDNHIGQFYH